MGVLGCGRKFKRMFKPITRKTSPIRSRAAVGTWRASDGAARPAASFEECIVSGAKVSSVARPAVECAARQGR
jgi:hypothetical protein